MEMIDWASVDWLSVIIYSVLVFITAIVANFINALFDGNPFVGALLASILFAAAFVGWNYYPHGIDIGQKKPGVETQLGPSGTGN